MKKKQTIFAVAMFSVSGVAMMAPRPALAWDKAWCDAHHVTTGECAHWYPAPTPLPIIVNRGGQGGKGGNATATGGSASASANAAANAAASVTNRVSQSLSNVGSPVVYTNVRQAPQISLNAPDCGGVNGELGGDLNGDVTFALAAHLFGPKPDSCFHHDEPAPVVNVHVDAPAAAAAASVPVASANLPPEVRWRVRPACAPDATRKQDLALLHRDRKILRYRQPTQEMLEAADRLCMPLDTLYALDDPK